MVVELQQPESMGTDMALFDLNNIHSADAPGSTACDRHARAFQADVLAPVKSVQRLSSHAWPFCIKSSAVPDIADGSRHSQAASSFVT